MGGFIGFSIYTIDESLKSDTYKNEWESTTKIYWICAGFLSFTVVFAFVFMICTCISSKRSQDLISVGAMFTNLLLLSVAYILYSQKDE